MKKNLIFIFLILTILVFFLINFSIFFYSIKNHYYNKNLFYPFYRKNINKWNFKDVYNFRKPIGTNYKKNGIIVFGCGFAEGINLTDENTFAYQLSEYTKRPVYNRAIAGGFIQHAILQVESGEINNIIKNSSDVIYIISGTCDSLRLYTYPGNYFDPFFIANKYVYPTYTFNKNKELKLKITKIPIVTSSCIYRVIQKFILEYSFQKKKEKDKFIKLSIMHLEKLQKELKKINPNIKMHVLLYWDDELLEYSKDIILDFNIISLIDITPESNNILFKIKEQNIDAHPTKESWEYLVPIISKSLNLN